MTTNYLSPNQSGGPGRLFTLHNDRDMSVTISERGAALVSWWAPDRYGRLADVLLGAAHGEPATPARARASAAAHKLDAQLWQGEMAGKSVALRLSGTSASETVEVEMRYCLDDEGRLTIECEALAREGATVDLGSQPRFNLNGGRDDVGDHMLQIDADYYLKIDNGGIPLGVAAVGGTPFDFRKPAAIGPRLRWPDVQIRLAGGFDHCFCIGEYAAGAQGALREVAQVYDPRSGRCLKVATTDAGLRFYSGGAAAAGGQAPQPGICLEACANPEQLGSAHAGHMILHPRQVYRRTTVYELSLQL
jgi:aldose 1-epimerase